MTKALVVLSGGQDSTFCLFWAVQKYGRENVHAVTYHYGQRHLIEIEAAMDVARLAKIAGHELLRLPDNTLLGTSPLTDKDQPLEQYTDHAQMEKVIGDRVEKTFVPMRNALFLTLSANRAFVLGCGAIITGVCQQDNANYPDCREEFIDDQEKAINRALGNDPTVPVKDLPTPWIYILTPLMHCTKAEAIVKSLAIPGAYSALAYSHTAYDGKYPPVGKDHASVLRAHGFEEANIPDPLVMRAVIEGVMEKPSTRNYDEDPWYRAAAHIKKELAVLLPHVRTVDPWWIGL